jgi:hypothetical protein
MIIVCFLFNNELFSSNKYAMKRRVIAALPAPDSTSDHHFLLHSCYGETTPRPSPCFLFPQSALLDEGESTRLEQLSEALSRWRPAVDPEL